MAKVPAETGFLELPVTWGHMEMGLRYGAAQQNLYFPTYEELIVSGKPVIERPCSVILNPYPDMVETLREWISDHVGLAYRKTGLFWWQRHNFADEKICKGVRFTFEDVTVAVLAKMQFTY